MSRICSCDGNRWSRGRWSWGRPLLGFPADGARKSRVGAEGLNTREGPMKDDTRTEGRSQMRWTTWWMEAVDLDEEERA